MKHAPMQTEAGFTIGPIAIPMRRQIAQNLFRIFSIKAGMRVVTCESSLEAEAVYAAEGDPNITWLCEQPLRIDQPIGKRPRYTFDLATRNQEGEVRYYEIKPSEQLIEAKDGKPKPVLWDQLEPICRDAGYTIDFITEIDLAPKKMLIENWRMLLPFAAQAYSDPDQGLSENLINLTSSAGLSLRDLCLAEPDRDDGTIVAHLAMLLHKGELTAPLDSTRLVPSTKTEGANHE